MTKDEGMTDFEVRKGRGGQHSSFGIRDSFVIGPSSFGSSHAIPLERRMPHSAMKQARANWNTLDRCQRGCVQLSVMGALRFGSPVAKLSSRDGVRTSPPDWRATVSISARFG